MTDQIDPNKDLTEFLGRYAREVELKFPEAEYLVTIVPQTPSGDRPGAIVSNMSNNSLRHFTKEISRNLETNMKNAEKIIHS